MNEAWEVREAEEDWIGAVVRQLSASLVHLLEETPYLRRQYLDGDCRLVMDKWGVSVEVATDDEPERPAWFTGGKPDDSA